MDTENKIKPFITEQGGQSRNADYLAWKEKKIQESIDWANANPDKMIPEHEVWRELGFEY